VQDAKLADQHAARAIALLRRAQGAGHFQEAANGSHLKTDPDLNGLRQRNDFQKFLAEVEAAPASTNKK
jgi:hypothetical protein